MNPRHHNDPADDQLSEREEEKLSDTDRLDLIEEYLGGNFHTFLSNRQVEAAQLTDAEAEAEQATLEAREGEQPGADTAHHR